jgi:uncharacterized protein (DUF302 family)
MPEEIGFEVHLDCHFDEAVKKVVAALKTEGFGVLTRVDVKATLKEKLGEDFRPYVIMGACNPPLAYRSLSAEGAVGLMLPCNVTVEADPHGGSLARIANPETMMQVSGLQNNPTLGEVAAEARTRLERVAGVLREKG